MAESARRGYREMLAAFIGAAVVAVVFYPVLQDPNRNRPAWVKEGDDWVFAVGIAIRRYAGVHHGRPPASLSDLYPRYTTDIRVIQRTALFGREQLVIDYRHPRKLGGSAVVLELRLDRQPRRGEYARPVRLYGDLHHPIVM